MDDKYLQELIAEMIAADETAAAARALVTEYMGAHDVKKANAAGHDVRYIKEGYTTAYKPEMEEDDAYIIAKAAYDAARAQFAYKKPRVAYIRVSVEKGA